MIGAVGGLPEPMEDHAVRVVDLALALVEGASSRYFSQLQLRVGVHSGPAAGGVIGTRKFAYDVWGDTVNLASRLETYGVPGRVHVSEETRALSDTVFDFEARSPIEMRGVGVRSTYLVIGRRRPMEASGSFEGRALG